MDEDAELMRRVSIGDEGAFRSIVERHQKGLYNFFLRSTGSAEDAEDLIQQLFLNLYRTAVSYRPAASFRTYIYRIASNMAISFARRRRSRAGTRSLEQMLEGGYEPSSSSIGSNPSKFVETRELQKAYVEALMRLPRDWRTAIELKVGKDFSYKEIAEILGRSVSAVESILFRARERLAKELKGYRGGG